jgi:FkbH-like protein
MDAKTTETVEQGLRDLIRAAEQAKAPELDTLTVLLGQRLLAANRLSEAAELIRGAIARGGRLPSALSRQLAQAQRLMGDVVGAEATVRELLKRDGHDVDAQRLLYRLVAGAGRVAEANRALDRLVEIDPTAATATFVQRERAKIGPMSGKPVRIALLSSYVLDALVPFLDAECRRAGLVPEFYVGPYNQYTQEILAPTSELYTFKPDVVFIGLDLEDLFPAMRSVPSAQELSAGKDEIRRNIASLVRELRKQTPALVVVHELAFAGRTPHGILDSRRPDGVTRWIEDVNREVGAELATQTHAFLLPLREVLARVGAAHGQSPKLHYMARMRHTDPMLRELAQASMRYVKPLKGLTRKCVVVDLDGTLWGGVVGELGPEGIHLGPAAPGVEYVDFQEALLNLTRRGILLAVCSKNNVDDVMPVLRDHKHMVLREEHFAALRINWTNKAENLASIAEELNIGLDSFVFLDDNPVERELIRQMLPEVLVVDLPRDASLYRATLESLTDFELLAITKEDEQRASQYQANRKRQTLERTSGSLDGYLRSLEIRALVAPAAAHHVARLVQMFNKTNQFNATTRRYQTPDMERFLASPTHHVYVLEVADRFGDHGLVGAAIAVEEPDAWRIDSVLLSCRAMGLSAETVLLKRIYDAALAKNAARLVGEFIPTKKNGPTADFYSRHGFRLDRESEGAQAWGLDPHTARIDDPAWIAVQVSGA